MSDAEGNKRGKGFKGLHALGAKPLEPPCPPEREWDSPAIPPAWKETNASQLAHAQPQSNRSHTAAPRWRGWLIGVGILGAILLLVVWAGNQSSSRSSYSPSLVTDHSSAVPGFSQTGPSGPTIMMPPVGDGLVLTSFQIRYCVYESRRIKGAEKAVDTYSQYAVSTYNAMVDDYNSRCSNFRYRQGALTPIQDEADQIETQLEQEGRERMSSGNAAAADAAQAAADAAADAAVAPPNARVTTNDTGSPISDNYYSDAAAADAAAAAAVAATSASEKSSDLSATRGYSASVDPENLQTCLSGNYPSLCKRALLTDSQKIRVADAERRENLRTCLSGNYPSLCNRSLLSNAEQGQVDQAERRENLRTCLTGNYPTLCNRSMLAAGELSQVEDAERRENLRICLSGDYPSLCNRSLLTDAERIQAARAESRP